MGHSLRIIGRMLGLNRVISCKRVATGIYIGRSMPTMLGGGLTGIPPILPNGDENMTSNKARSQTRIAVGDSDPIVIDAEGALDELYSALANERRREVLSVLIREPTPMDVKTLARQLTVQEACDNSKMVTEESIREVHVTLHHNHLPKLADLNLIEYDTDEETVEEVAGAIDSVRL